MLLLSYSHPNYKILVIVNLRLLVPTLSISSFHVNQFFRFILMGRDSRHEMFRNNSNSWVPREMNFISERNVRYRRIFLGGRYNISMMSHYSAMSQSYLIGWNIIFCKHNRTLRVHLDEVCYFSQRRWVSKRLWLKIFQLVRKKNI